MTHNRASSLMNRGCVVPQCFEDGNTLYVLRAAVVIIFIGSDGEKNHHVCSRPAQDSTQTFFPLTNTSIPRCANCSRQPVSYFKQTHGSFRDHLAKRYPYFRRAKTLL